MTTKTKTKHTPGPWALYFQHMSSPVICPGGKPSTILAGIRSDTECWEADARLIAAAPELLSVLNEAIPFLFKLSGALDIFHKAVAVRDRAMGETP